jgi:hypothetical protein
MATSAPGLKAFKRLLNEDEVINTLFGVVESIQSTINFKRMGQEAAALHAGRPSRNLYRIALQPTPLYEATMKDLSARARLTELRVGAMREHLPLLQSIKETKSYLSVKYAEDLNDLAGTQRDRDRLIDAILAKPSRTASELQQFLEILDVYIEDIDKAGYGLTNSVHILQKLLERPNQVV